MKYYLIDEVQLAALKRAATRLYSEQRLDGDAMRDLAHDIAAITRVCEELEVWK